MSKFDKFYNELMVNENELTRQERIDVLRNTKNVLQFPSVSDMQFRYEELKQNPPRTFIELERELEEIVGKEALYQAYADIEENYGINGLDAYHNGAFDLLFDALEGILRFVKED